jgi:prepilin-type N-terminal cleavage/methylation domain-containing protein
MNGSDAMILTKKIPRIANNKGFTLIELIIVMAIFIVAIILSSDAFNRIVMYSKQQMRASESNIQGVVGLELMRTDLEHAGYGLPWIMGFEAAFTESTNAANSLANGINPTDFNDDNLNSTATAEDANKVPRAVQSKKSTVDERDYLVVKSTALGSGAAVKKWAYIEGVGGTSTIKVWGESDLDFVEDDRVVTLDSRTRRLIGTSTSNFSYALSGSPLAPDTDFQPTQDTDVFVVYGVSGSVDLRSPYNRVDYYVRRPAEISTRCAAGTGNLYKGVMSHADGKATAYPLLDCVADLQVVYALDTNEDGGVDDYTNEDGLESLSAKQIRAQLKEIRVYILTQEGQRDRSYNFPTNDVLVGENLLGADRGRIFDFAVRGVTDWKNYRWKIYTLVTAPKNIN